MKAITDNNICPYRRDRRRQSIECANCRYNRVTDIRRFELTRFHRILPTAGTVCIADEQPQYNIINILTQ